MKLFENIPVPAFLIIAIAPETVGDVAVSFRKIAP
jgi:hypothetical protein